MPELASISRAVLDALPVRRPMSAKDIAGKIMEARGLNLADPKLRRQMNKRVDMALRYQRTNGVVCEVALDGVVGWKLRD